MKKRMINTLPVASYDLILTNRGLKYGNELVIPVNHATITSGLASTDPDFLIQDTFKVLWEDLKIILPDNSKYQLKQIKKVYNYGWCLRLGEMLHPVNLFCCGKYLIYKDSKPDWKSIDKIEKGEKLKICYGISDFYPCYRTTFQMGTHKIVIDPDLAYILGILATGIRYWIDSEGRWHIKFHKIRFMDKFKEIWEKKLPLPFQGDEREITIPYQIYKILKVLGFYWLSPFMVSIPYCIRESSRRVIWNFIKGYIQNLGFRFYSNFLLREFQIYFANETIFLRKEKNTLIPANFICHTLHEFLEDLSKTPYGEVEVEIQKIEWGSGVYYLVPVVGGYVNNCLLCFDAKGVFYKEKIVET